MELTELEMQLIIALRDLERATYEASYESDHCIKCDRDPSLHECHCRLSKPRAEARALLSRPEVDDVRKAQRREKMTSVIRIELEQEVDGRWIADIEGPEGGGVFYGDTPLKAVREALMPADGKLESRRPKFKCAACGGEGGTDNGLEAFFCGHCRGAGECVCSVCEQEEKSEQRCITAMNEDCQVHGCPKHDEPPPSSFLAAEEPFGTCPECIGKGVVYISRPTGSVRRPCQRG